MLKKYFAILAVMCLTCTALDISALARIENFDKIRRNIIVLKYDEYNVDQRLIEKIKELEGEVTILKRKSGRFIEIFIPDRHPICEKGLLRQGRVVELSDVKKSESSSSGLKEYRRLFIIENIESYNDLTNIMSTNVLKRLRYDGEKYTRISGFIWDDREILKLSGVREENLV